MRARPRKSLQKSGVAYVKGVANFADNARGLMIGETGKLKLLFRRDDLKLLGVHCVGEGRHRAGAHRA